MSTKARPRRHRRHVPMRTCVVCRTLKPKRELIRLVRTPEEGVQVDPTGKRAGRGAYLCASPACWEKAIAAGTLGRALKMTLTEEDRDRLRRAAPHPDAAPGG